MVVDILLLREVVSPLLKDGYLIDEPTPGTYLPGDTVAVNGRREEIASTRLLVVGRLRRVSHDLEGL